MRLLKTLLVLFVCLYGGSRFVVAQTIVELTTADPGGADIGLYNDNQRGAFTNQDASGGVDVRDLGSDGIIDDSETTRKRAGLLQFDFEGIVPSQVTGVDLELFQLQGSTTAEIEIYGVNDGDDILGLAGDGSPGFDPTDPDFHFANSGLFHYYDHEDASLPDGVPPIPDDDDFVNGGFFDSTLDLDMTKVELIHVMSEESDEEPDMIFSLFSDETPGLLDFVRKDTNGKVLFLLMPTGGQVVTLNNGGNGAAASLYVTIDESVTPGDFDSDGDFDIDDVNALIAGFGGADGQFDLTGDGAVDSADLNRWIKDIRKTWIGDANLDGEFNSGDFVAAFTSGKFETPQAATWSEGDWNGDGSFNSSDFVAAFTDGGFELGPLPAAESVPEPSLRFSFIATLGLLLVRQRIRSSVE